MSRKDKCFDGIKKRLSAEGKELNEKEAKQILETLGGLKEVSEATGKFEDFRQMSMDYLKSVRQFTIEQKINRARATLINNRNKAFMGSVIAKYGIDGAAEAVGSRMYKSNNLNIDGGGVNVESVTRSTRNNFSKAFHLGLEELNLKELAKSKEADLHVAIELYELQTPGGQVGKTKSQSALQMAKVITGVQRQIMTELRAAGFHLNDLTSRITQQSHDRFLIKTAEVEKWTDDILKIGLDEDKTFGKGAALEQKREFLAAAYKVIVEGKNEVADISDIFGEGKREKVLGNKYNSSRKIHFKDGESFYHYNKAYGKRGIMESVQSEIDSASRAIGVAKVFGVDPKKSFDHMMGIAEREVTAKGTKKEYQNFLTQKESLDEMFEGLTGPQNIAGQNMRAKAGAGARSMWRMGALGMSAITNLTDIASHAANITSKTGKNLFQSHFDFMQDGLSLVKDKEVRKLVQKELHLFFDDTLREHARRSGGDADVPGMISSAERMFFTANGLAPQQHIFKLAAAKGFARDLFSAANGKFADLDPRMELALSKVKIGEKELVKLQAAGVSIHEEMHITPESVLRATEDKELSLKVSQFITDNAGLVGDPSSGLKYGFWGVRNVGENTTRGQVPRMVGVMKTFPMHMQHMLTEVVLSDPNIHALNLSGAFKTAAGRSSATKAMAGYMAGASTIAYLSWSLKEILKGKTPPDPKDPQTWAKSFLSSGAGGMYADLIQSQEYNEDPGKGIAKTLAGPILSELVFDVPGIVKKIAKSKDKIKTATKEGVVFGTRHLPGNNLPFVKPAIDMLWLNEIKEASSPGYLRKRKDALEKQGQSYWLPKVNER